MDAARPASQDDKIPVSPEWVGVSEAARMLGVSRTSVYYRIYDQGKFQQVYRLGDEEGERSVLILSRREVEQVVREEQQEQPRPLRVRRFEWTKRVKAWAQQAEWAGHVARRGRLTDDLVAAYEQGHPEDPKPV